MNCQSIIPVLLVENHNWYKWRVAPSGSNGELTLFLLILGNAR